MNITSYLNSKGFHEFEGYSQQVPQQVADLIHLTSQPNVKIMEIGFNAGHSAEVFLKNNSSATLLSFDLGIHSYVAEAKRYIDFMYPHRHNLIFGDSTQMVPNFIKNNKDAKFDVIFIDGGHEYEIAKQDINNCSKLAHKDTIVIIDDTIFVKGWEQAHTIGPTQTWYEHLQEKTIVNLESKNYSPGRGMSWGKYIM
jgi:predicted O-methyltransferase YrrM